MKDRNGRTLRIGNPVKIVDCDYGGDVFPIGTKAEYRGFDDNAGFVLIYIKDHGDRGHNGLFCPSTATPTGDEYGHWLVWPEEIERIEPTNTRQTTIEFHETLLLVTHGFDGDDPEIELVELIGDRDDSVIIGELYLDEKYRQSFREAIVRQLKKEYEEAR